MEALSASIFPGTGLAVDAAAETATIRRVARRSGRDRDGGPGRFALGRFGFLRSCGGKSSPGRHLPVCFERWPRFTTSTTRSGSGSPRRLCRSRCGACAREGGASRRRRPLQRRYRPGRVGSVRLCRRRPGPAVHRLVAVPGSRASLDLAAFERRPPHGATRSQMSGTQKGGLEKGDVRVRQSGGGAAPGRAEWTTTR